MIRFFKSYQLGWPKLLAAWRSDVFLMAISTVRALWLWTKRVWLRCLPQESSKSLLFCVGACFILRIFLHIHRVIGFWYAVLPLAFVWFCFFVDYKCWTNSFNQRFRGQPRFPVKLQLIIQRLIIFTLQLSKSSTKAPSSKMINVIHQEFPPKKTLFWPWCGHSSVTISVVFRADVLKVLESEHQIASTRGSTWIHYCWWKKSCTSW